MAAPWKARESLLCHTNPAKRILAVSVGKSCGEVCHGFLSSGWRLGICGSGDAHGKPSVCMVLDPMPNGYHSPYHIITGKTPQTARHATVLMRKETFDLQYRYWGGDASSLVGGKRRFTDEEMWSTVKEWDEKGYCQSCGSRRNYKGILAGLQWILGSGNHRKYRKNLINLRCSV